MDHWLDVYRCFTVQFEFQTGTNTLEPRDLPHLAAQLAQSPPVPDDVSKVTRDCLEQNSQGQWFCVQKLG